MRPRRLLSTSVRQLLDARAAKFPAKDLCRFEGQDVRWSIGDLRKHSRAFAGGLLANGFVPGSSLLLVLPNNLERLAFLIGAAQAQAIVAVIDGTPTVAGLKAALEHSGARGVIMGPKQVEPLLRNAVPELHLNQVYQPEGGVNSGRPLVSQGLPNLRRAWHTGYGKEAMVHRVRDMLLYNPSPCPLQSLTADKDAPFFAMYTPEGQLVRSSLQTQAQIVDKAAKLAKSKLALSTEDKLLLASAGNPETSLVAALACLDACAQLIVPSNPAKVEDLCASEGVTSTVGELPVPKKGLKAATV